LETTCYKRKDIRDSKAKKIWTLMSQIKKLKSKILMIKLLPLKENNYSKKILIIGYDAGLEREKVVFSNCKEWKHTR